MILLPTVATGFAQSTFNYAFHPPRQVFYSSMDGSEPSNVTVDDAPFVEAVPVDPVVVNLQKQLLQLATATNRGFTASPSERKQARELIYDLANYNPTTEPARPFYNATATFDADNADSPALAGKWTLVYTDAPDITSLDRGGPIATAKLGRIGQECSPPVIEWKQPDWAGALPFSGTDESRVLQKVVTEASASPEKPLIVNLKVAGIEIVGAGGSSSDSLEESIQQDGLPAAWFQKNPLELKGPLTAPFGQFAVLYLDDQFRIIKTGQNFVAVNVRNEQDWF